MKRFLPALILLALVGPAGASNQSDVEAVVHRWTDSFNKGDMKGAAALCGDEGLIIDDFPPYEWRGQGACGAWIDSFNAWAKQNNLTFDHAQIAKVNHIDITGDTAYVPTLLVFALKNKDGGIEAEKGTWSVVLKKSIAGWKIADWSWESLGPVKAAKP